MIFFYLKFIKLSVFPSQIKIFFLIIINIFKLYCKLRLLFIAIHYLLTANYFILNLYYNLFLTFINLLKKRKNIYKIIIKFFIFIYNLFKNIIYAF